MASTYIGRTQGSPTNAKKWTISFWAKFQVTNGNWYPIFGCDYDIGDSYFGIGSGGHGRNEIGFLEYHTSATNYGQGSSNFSLRDPSAWYHVVFAYDSTQGTAANRGKTYINGVQATNTYSTDIPSNHDSRFNMSGSAISIGRRMRGPVYMDGVLSHFHFVDGTAYDPTSFGETDSTTGEWKIKANITGVNYGNNGFFVLKNGNSLTDESPNTNNFTLGNGTLSPTVDNPSNVFATLNPLDKGYVSSALSLSSGMTVTNATTNFGDYGIRSTLGASSGKYYWEAKIATANTLCILPMDTKLVINMSDGSPENHLYGVQRYNDSTSNIYDNGTFVQNTSAMWGGLTSSDIISFALDLDNGKLFLAKNGAYKNQSGSTGDPVNGTNPTFTISDTTRTYGFYSEMRGNDNNGTIMNFGNGYFGTTAVASAGTNASNNGTFEYDVPTGYTALSTKGLNL